MKPRGLLIANPNATTTSPRIRDVITGALGHELDLEVITTTHRGHAFEIAAKSHGLDLLITLGGDGTINETVNGMLSSGRTDDLPVLATIPGGSANVMARALGFPNDAIEATGMILESLRLGSSHHIGLGSARFAPDSEPERTHWFTINAGVGLDADVIASMEVQRSQGHAATGLRYLRTTVQEYFKDPERKEPTIQLEQPGHLPIPGLAMVIVQNTAPWTFLGPIPINPCPDASFDLGLDVFAPHSLGVFSAARFGARMVRGSHAGEVRGGLTLLHDVSEFTIRSATPTNLQVDGDSMGAVEWVQFNHLPKALRIAG